MIVSSRFWNSSIVQHLRMICPKDVRFRESDSVPCDLLFPFCGSAAFSILYPDHLNQKGADQMETMVKTYRNSTIVVCLTADDSDQYSDFLTMIPTSISAAVCFAPDQFAKTTAAFIWQSASKSKTVCRKIDGLVEERRRACMDPDIQGARVFRELIEDDQQRREIIAKLNTETGTIRKTLTEGLPEIFKRDFYIESTS
jgi:hypothetical protein